MNVKIDKEDIEEGFGVVIESPFHTVVGTVAYVSSLENGNNEFFEVRGEIIPDDHGAYDPYGPDTHIIQVDLRESSMWYLKGAERVDQFDIVEISEKPDYIGPSDYK